VRPNHTALFHILHQPSYYTCRPDPSCSIKYFTREIIVFRYEALKAMRRRCLVPCEGAARCLAHLRACRPTPRPDVE
jgi:hypothetical protein